MIGGPVRILHFLERSGERSFGVQRKGGTGYRRRCDALCCCGRLNLLAEDVAEWVGSAYWLFRRKPEYDLLAPLSSERQRPVSPLDKIFPSLPGAVVPCQGGQSAYSAGPQ